MFTNTTKSPNECNTHFINYTTSTSLPHPSYFDFSKDSLQNQPHSVETLDKSSSEGSTLNDIKDIQDEDRLFDFCSFLEYQPVPTFQFTETENTAKIIKGSSKIKKERVQVRKAKEENHSPLEKTRGKRTIWKAEEDAQLLALYEEHGQQWSKIGSLMMNKTGKQVRERYINILRPDINNQKWTEQEEQLLYYLCEKFGKKWSQIAQYLPGRTENQVKNKFNMDQRKKKTSFAPSIIQTEEQQIEQVQVEEYYYCQFVDFNNIPEHSSIPVTEENVDAFLQRRESFQQGDWAFGGNLRESSWKLN